MLQTLSMRGWLSLLAALAAAFVLSIEMLQVAASPRYTEVRLAEAGAVGEATLALDRRGIRWRARPTADQQAVVGVESGRVDEAREILRADGLVRGPAGRRAADDEATPEERAERGLELRVNRLLEDTLGPGRARVGLDLVLDLDRRTQRRLRYGLRAAELSRRLERWRLRGDFQRGDGRYEDVVWARDRLVTAVRFAPGRIRRLSASLVADPALPDRDVRALRATVVAALGLDLARGDTLRVARVPFAESSAPKPGGAAAARLRQAVPWTILAVAIALFGAELWMCLRRRPPGPAAPPWLADGAPPRSSRP